MKNSISLLLAALLAGGILTGCATPAVPVAGSDIRDLDWQLVALGEGSSSVAAGERPPTLRLDSASARAAGFAGCNRYGAGYVLAGSSLRLTAPLSTRMACMDGMALEAAFLDTLPRITGYRLSEGVLVLTAGESVLATFSRP